MNKISNQNPPPIEPTQKVSPQRKVGGEKESGKRDAVIAQRDSVEFSDRAREAADLKEKIKSLPDTRSELVSKFENLIKEGKYEPAGKLIAEAIVREEY